MAIQTNPATDLWLRRWSISVVSSDGGTVLELSAGYASRSGGPATTGSQGEPLSEGLRAKFRTVAMDAGVPNHLEATVYNLSDATAKRVQNREFSGVRLQAGD